MVHSELFRKIANPTRNTHSLSKTNALNNVALTHTITHINIHMRVFLNVSEKYINPQLGHRSCIRNYATRGNHLICNANCYPSLARSAFGEQSRTQATECLCNSNLNTSLSLSFLLQVDHNRRSNGSSTASWWTSSTSTILAMSSKIGCYGPRSNART